MLSQVTPSFRILSVLAGLFLIPFSISAQLRISFPAERSVYQRDVSGYATLTVSGSYTQAIDKVEIKAVSVYPGQGVDTDWLTLTTQPAGGVFSGTVRLFGGWYTLLVRGLRNGAEVSQTAVSRTGVGEVFIIAGQSNAQGLRGTPEGAPAQDDRVNYLSNNENTSSSLLDPSAPAFAQLGASDASLNPHGQGAWCWGRLGDKLAAKLNVPILFINVAWEGTSIGNWAQSSRNEPTYNSYGGFLYPESMPYANLSISARHYAHTLGLRSILWMQGETDTYPLRTSRNEYRNSLQYLINKLMQDINKRVIWTITRTSRTSTNYEASGSITSDAIIGAQNDVLNTAFNPVYPGPETDGLGIPRPDGTHFMSRAALNVLGDAWDNVMNTTYFTTITPVSPAATPQLTVACSGNNNSLTLTLPSGFNSYRWSTGSTSRALTVTSPGTYSAVVKDANGNALISNSLVVSSVRPATPSILPAGSQQVCEGLDFNYNVSGGHTYSWFREGSDTPFGTGSTIAVNTEGTYTVQAQNVFGCFSNISAGSHLTVQPAVPKPVVTSAGPFSLIASVEAQSLPATFEWYLNGQLLPQANESVYKIAGLDNGESGGFSARAKVVFTLPGSANTITCVSEMSDTLTYRRDSKEDIVAFPNPAHSNDVYIESRDPLDNVTVTLYNSNGQLLKTLLFDQLVRRERIETGNLPRGVYLMQISTTDWTDTKRIVLY